MIGNDIVDLKQAAADSNWRRSGYLRKIFTPAEQMKIYRSAAPEILVWLFWSMKEAAYKVFSREHGLRNFAPARITCTMQPDLDEIGILSSGFSKTISGQAVYRGTVYLTQSLLNFEKGYIHTLSARERKDLEKSTIEIGIWDACPYRQRNPASVSHHGRYLALAFMPSNAAQSAG